MEEKCLCWSRCRNEVRSIERCIDNVCSFDRPPEGFEVIVIDGMSTDGTREILSRLKSQFSDLVVIDNPGKIVPRAMNLGIQFAKENILFEQMRDVFIPRATYAI